MTTAEDIIEALSLSPHPEGGDFRETFRDTHATNGRAASTAIYYLLRKGERSHWHRIDAAEVWHFYAGAALTLSTREAGGVTRRQLGADIAAGEEPQLVVPAGVWQSAESCGAWSLVGCTVAPGFEFDKFELAPDPLLMIFNAKD